MRERCGDGLWLDSGLEPASNTWAAGVRLFQGGGTAITSRVPANQSSSRRPSSAATARIGPQLAHAHWDAANGRLKLSH